MKRTYLTKVLAAAFLLIGFSYHDADGQAFRKGSLLISLSEGATYSHFTTRNDNPYNDGKSTEQINGDRDPLIVEYGLTDRWGIGLSSGGDIYHMNTAR